MPSDDTKILPSRAGVDATEAARIAASVEAAARNLPAQIPVATGDVGAATPRPVAFRVTLLSSPALASLLRVRPPTSILLRGTSYPAHGDGVCESAARSVGFPAWSAGSAGIAVDRCRLGPGDFARVDFARVPPIWFRVGDDCSAVECATSPDGSPVAGPAGVSATTASTAPGVVRGTIPEVVRAVNLLFERTRPGDARDDALAEILEGFVVSVSAKTWRLK